MRRSSKTTNTSNPKTGGAGRSGNDHALIHGGTAEKLFLPQENPKDFEALLASLQADYQPETEQQHLFLEHLATAHWFLLRRQRACNAIEAKIYAAVDHQPEDLTDPDLRRIGLAERYKTTAERALKRALQNAESFRKDRQTTARWEAEHQLRARCVKLKEEKHANPPARNTPPSQQQQYRQIIWPESLPGSQPQKKSQDRLVAVPYTPALKRE